MCRKHFEALASKENGQARYSISSYHSGQKMLKDSAQNFRIRLVIQWQSSQIWSDAVFCSVTSVWISYQGSPTVSGDEGSLTRLEVCQIAYSLGSCSRQIFDQFANIALKSVRVRRRYVLDSFDWPSSKARSWLEQLPVLGDDLFNDQFLEFSKKEVVRHREASEATFPPVGGKLRRFRLPWQQSCVDLWVLHVFKVTYDIEFTSHPSL